MGVVPEEAINQFEALMEEGLLLFLILPKKKRPFLNFSGFMFVTIFIWDIYAVEEPLKGTFKVYIVVFSL